MFVQADYIFLVRFPTGHYHHRKWPVENASPGMCPCKWWIFWSLTPFVNKLLQIFHAFFVQVVSAHGVRILLCWCLMDDTPLLLKCKDFKPVNEQKVKWWIFCSVNICTYFHDFWHIYWTDHKVTFKTCFTCTKSANFWFLSFPR